MGVVLGYRRGRYKLQRLAKEKVNKKVIRPRFPKAIEFIFQGAFLYNWKAIIWSDETGVVLGHRRGGYKLWRLAKEKVNKKVIRPRFPKAIEFIFQGAFLYDRKAPCHIQRLETIVEKEALKRELKAINGAIKPELRQAQELNTGI